MGDSDTSPINNTGNNGFCRVDEVFLYTYIYLFSIFLLYSSRFLSKAEYRCCHMLRYPDLRTCLQEQVILQALPRAAVRANHIPHRAQWGTPTTTCARRDTFVPRLGKQESWIVPLQTCVPCKCKGWLPSQLRVAHTAHAVPLSQRLAGFCIPPCHSTPAPACPQPTHAVFP